MALMPADLLRCRGLADDRARLACYDALAATARPATPAAAPVAPPVPPAGTAAGTAAVVAAPQPPAAPAASPTAETDFGRTGAGPQQVETRIDGLFEGWDRNTRIRLANGQVWQVIDGSAAALALRDPVVRVRRAALGSFLMEFEGTNRTVRVRRAE